jgi:hypothetical protein
MVRDLGAIALVSALTILTGCSSVPTVKEIDVKLVAESRTDLYDGYRYIDARMSVPTEIRSAQIASVSGELIPEGFFNPSSLEFLKAAINDHDYKRALVSSEIVVKRFDVTLASGRKFGEGASDSQRYAAAAVGPYGPLGLAIGDAILRVATSKGIIVVNVYLTIDHSGKSIEVVGTTDLAGGPLGTPLVRAAVFDALIKRESLLKP